MRTKSSLYCGAAFGVMLAVGLGAAAQAKTSKKHHHHEAAPPAASAEEVKALADEIESLKARLDQEQVAREQTEAKAQAAQAEAESAKADAQAAHSQLAEQIQTLPGTINTAVAAAKPKTDKLYYKGISVTMGGFAAAETAYRSHDETADIGSSFAKMPFANDKASHTSSETFTGRQSRYSALVQGDISSDIHAAFYGEFDFLGAAQTANSNESNSYQPRVRNLYGQVDWDQEGWHVLAGQNWSLASMNTKGITPRSETPPPTIDAQYVPGFVWARQPQIRLTKDFNKELWIAISVENPQTTFGNVTTASGVSITNTQAPTSQFYNGTNYSLNNIPDVIGKVAFDNAFAGHALHAELYGLLRNYMDRVQIAAGNASGYAAGVSNQTTSGGGVGGGVNFAVVPNMLDVTGSFLTGDGVGRYGSAQLPDVTARPNGKLEGIRETMWLAGATLHATPALDVYVFGGEEAERSKTFGSVAAPGSALFGYGTIAGSTNAGCVVEGGACSAVTKSIDQVSAGLWDKVYNGSFGQVRIGLQYSYTERKAFADAAGLAPKATENMVFTSFRYYPF